jgi:hypothetical protein
MQQQSPEPVSSNDRCTIPISSWRGQSLARPTCRRERGHAETQQHPRLDPRGGSWAQDSSRPRLRCTAAQETIAARVESSADQDVGRRNTCFRRYGDVGDYQRAPRAVGILLLLVVVGMLAYNYWSGNGWTLQPPPAARGIDAEKVRERGAEIAE